MKDIKIKRRLNYSVGIVFSVIAFWTIVVLSMYAWGISTSLKDIDQFQDNVSGFVMGWPWEWQWANYATAMSEIYVNVNLPGYVGPVYFDTMIVNSVLYTIGGAMIANITTWIAGYLISKFWHYKTSRFLYTINIALLTIPVIGTLPACLAVFKFFGWYNNYSFILFNNIGFIGTHILYYTAFFDGLGREYYEAAFVDGAGNWTIMWKIAFPLTANMFTVILLLKAIVMWNDYMTMLIWMPDYPSLAYGVYSATTSVESAMAFPPARFAACIILAAPILVAFFAFQDKIMGNLRLGALKG